MSLFNTRRAESRKKRSERFLLSQHVQINPNLPEIANEADAEIKSPEEAVKRVVTAFLAAQIAIDICNGETGTESAEFFTNIIWELGLDNELTADEKKYFALADERAPRISPEAANQFQWRIETCMPLFWACGFLGDDYLPFPSDIPDPANLIQLLGGCHMQRSCRTSRCTRRQKFSTTKTFVCECTGLALRRGSRMTVRYAAI